VFYQKTIRDSVKFEGIGLHSGENVGMVLCPAPPDTGVVFRSNGVSIAALHENVADTSYATSLLKDGVRVRTVEHLLSALAGLSIDNLYVELSGDELPIMDGSAWPFVKALKEAGLVTQGAPRRFLKVVRPITVHEGDKSATLLPSSVTQMTFRIDFDHPMLHDQRYAMELDPEGFEVELSKARTFAFRRDADMLTRAGLGKGGSAENVVILEEDGIFNEEGLRYPDEFVRHKMMDAVGDLSLIGMPFIGHLVADKSGHKLNQRLVAEVMRQTGSWIVVEGGATEQADVSSNSYTLAEAM